ncbi:MAG: hypothetical protein OHK0053_32810 [Microscillaceae bacterium]
MLHSYLIYLHFLSKGLRLLGAILWCFACSPLFAQDEPRLVIDTQGHASTVGTILFTPDGKTLISVSEDKTIRFWDVRTGELKKTLRGQVGEGPEGKIYAVAISPDGQILAVGGYLSFNNDAEYGRIRLIDLNTGRQKGILTGHTNVVYSLDFSSDGKYLASGSGDKSIRVWDMSLPQPAQVAVLNGHTQSVQEVVFLNPKKLVSVAYDGLGIIWDWRNNAIERKLEGHTDKVSGLDCSPDGRYIATTGYDNRLIIWDKSGQKIREIDRGNYTYTVAFAADGEKLVVHGTLGTAGTVYKSSTGEVVSEFKKHTNTVIAAAFWANSLVATAGGDNNEIYLWDANTGQTKLQLMGHGTSKKTIGFERQNSLRVAFGNQWGGMNGAGALQFAFDFEKLQPMQVESQSFYKKTDTLRNGQKLVYVDKLTLDIGNTGSIQAQDNTEGWIRAFSYTPRGEIAVGYNYVLKIHDVSGNTLREMEGHTSEVWAVSVSPDGRLLASASGDQTISLWSLDEPGEVSSVNQIYTHPSWGEIWKKNNWEDLAKTRSREAWLQIIANLQKIGYETDAQTLTEKLAKLTPVVRPLVTLFLATDGEWVCWTPQGYYAASADGEKYIGWHLNQGVEQMSDYYPVSSFRKKYFKPDLIKLVVKLGNFERALAEYNLSQQQNAQVAQENILSNLPPKVEWLNPVDNQLTVNASKFRLKARITSDSPITGVKVLVNGRAMANARGFEVVSSNTDKEQILDLEVELTNAENTLLIFASNQNSSTLSEERILKLSQQGIEAQRDMGSRDLAIDVEEFTLKPNLYVVSVGVSNFAKMAYNLEFADDDAAEMAQLLQTQQGRLYNKVEVKTLLNEQATRTNILDAFYWLEQSATQHDMVMIFIATHGFNEREKFYILPHDGDHERLRTTGVDWADFQDVLGNLPSKVVMFLDACHSGQLGSNVTFRGTVDNSEAIREITSPEHGVVVLSASTGSEKSLESPEWGHGAFTLALLRALRDQKADFDKDGIVYLRELDFFVAEEVKNLTKGRQHPTTQKPSTISRLPILQLR